MTESLVLRVESGAQRGKTFDLSGLSGRWVIGSDPTAEIRLIAPGVAARHAELGRLKDGTLGVRVTPPEKASMNGAPIESARWTSGERLEMGGVVLALVPAAKPVAPVAPVASAPGFTSSTSAPAAAAPAPASTRGDESDALVGKEIGGYRLLARLGKGGMGTVYRALQMRLEREVALKLLSPELCAEPGFVDQFQREARAAGQLNHPSIVQVYDVGQDGPHHFYSMELIPHGSLETRLKREGKLPWRDALRAARDAAHGLEYAESKGIVHRDIKPDNLMLGERGVVKIADLGLAGRHEEEAQERGVLGTPHFMSPEQAQGLPVDARGDIYSLGATLYRILSGRTPFQGRTVKEIIRAQIQDQPAPLKDAVQDLPPRVSALIERMMRKDPAQRFASAADVVVEIDEALGEETAPKGAGAKKLVLVLVLLAAGGAAWFVFANKGAGDGAGSGARNGSGDAVANAQPSNAGHPSNGNSSSSAAGDPTNSSSSTQNPSGTGEPSATEREMREKLHAANAQLAFNAADGLQGTRAERAAAWKKVVEEFGETEAGMRARANQIALEAEAAALEKALLTVQRGDEAALERRDWAEALRAIAAPIAALPEALRHDPDLLAAGAASADVVAQRAEEAMRTRLMALAPPEDLAALDAARKQLHELEREVAFDEGFRSALPESVAKRFDLLRLAVVQRSAALEIEGSALGAARREGERLALWRALGGAGGAAENLLAHDYVAAAAALEACGKTLTEPDHAALCAARALEIEHALSAQRALASWLATPDHKPLQIEHPEGKGKVLVARLEGPELFVQKKREEAAQPVPLRAVDTLDEVFALYEPLQASNADAAPLGALLALQTSVRGALLARNAIAEAIRGDEQAGRDARTWFRAGFDAAERALATAPAGGAVRAMIAREKDVARELAEALEALAEGRLGAADLALARLEEIGRGSWIFALITEGRGALAENGR